MGELKLNIEVAYAKPDEQILIKLQISEGASALQAILASGIPQRCPEINLEQAEVGIFGKTCTKSTLLNEGDRVEIYRALHRSPKEARRLRAAKP